MRRAAPSGRQPLRPAARCWPARSRRPCTSSWPSFRPRSEMTTRCGTPISSQSANIAPGRSPRSSSMTSMPSAASSSCSASAAARTVGVAVVADRAQHHRERRDRVRPDDAARVVVLLDGRAEDARHADAVAAHLHQLRLAGLVEEGGVHRLAVLGAEVEHMADLDAALDGEHALAVGRRVAGDDVADVGHQVGLGQVAAPVDAGEVEVFVVGAADEVVHRGHGAVGHHLDRLLRADRPQVAGLAAEVLARSRRRWRSGSRLSGPRPCRP